MTTDEIKKELYDNPTLIISILEDIGVHHIKQIKDRIQGAMPDGDNETSVQILLDNENLTSVVHTRGFSGDIFSLIEFIKGIDFINSVKYISTFCGFGLTYKIKQQSKKFKILDILFKTHTNNILYNNLKLDENLKYQFINSPHYLLVKDGVSIDTQMKYEICYDIIDSRIITPIRDEDGSLITFKGRDNTGLDYKPKFLSYYEYDAKLILFGLYQNKEYIKLSNEVNVFEGEKSVMQLDTIGEYNGISLSKKRISDEQVDKIISLQCNVNLAFDKDVKINEIIHEANKIRKYANVYIIYDFENILNEKDSPTDKGSDIWYKLYNNRVHIDKFEELLINE